MPLDVARARVQSQGLATPIGSPAEVVRAFGAMQAQDYPGALWAIAQRAGDATEADVERAVEQRALVRTWPMRGTLHFVAPELARPLLRTLAPRVIRRAARRYQELGLDDATFRKSRALFEEALRDGEPRTRDDLYAVLARAKIDPNNQRGVHVLGRLAMEGVLCQGPRRGKQFTFTLLDRWLPDKESLDDDEALNELSRRYFTTHGPATANDFAWWTGLTLGEARRYIGRELTEHLVDDRRLFAAATEPAPRGLLHLLPAYDELTVAYRDRSDFLDPAHAERAGNGIFSPVIALDGKIVGTWTRKTTRAGIAISTELFGPVKRALLRDAVARYGRFTGREAALSGAVG